MAEQIVPGTPDGGKGGSEEQKKPADADVSVLLKRLDEQAKELAALKDENKKSKEIINEVVASRQDAKKKLQEEADKAKAEADAKKTLEEKLAEMDKTWNQKWIEKENAEKAEKEKLQSELKQQKLINAISGFEGLHPAVKPEAVLSFVQKDLKFDEAGALIIESLKVAIESNPFLMVGKEIKPKVPMAAGKPIEKEPGTPDEIHFTMARWKERKKSENKMKFPQ